MTDQLPQKKPKETFGSGYLWKYSNTIERGKLPHIKQGIFFFFFYYFPKLHGHLPLPSHPHSNNSRTTYTTVCYNYASQIMLQPKLNITW